MQDMDLYTGKNNNFSAPQFDTQDPEYFTRLSKAQTREEIRTQKKATRIISFVAALCIISFTSGLIIGLKFGKENNNELVDNKTKNNVEKIKEKVSSMISKEAHAEDMKTKSVENRFPKEDFPLVIKIGNAFTAKQSKNVARYLSQKSIQVIISQKNEIFKVYAGPYRNYQEAEIFLQKIKNYSDNRFYNQVNILKR